MKFANTLFLILMICSICSAQNIPGVGQVGLNGSNVSSYEDAFSIYLNPALHNSQRAILLGVFYSPAPYGLSELSNIYSAANFKSEYGNIGFGLSTFGFELYRESSVKLNYSSNIYNCIVGGLSINLFHLNIKNYGSREYIFVDTGLLITSVYDFSIGMSINNIGYGKSESSIRETCYRFGLEYILAESINLNIADEYTGRFGNSIKLGIESLLFTSFKILTSYKFSPKSIAAGFRVEIKNIFIGYALNFHSILGITNQFQLEYGF